MASPGDTRFRPSELAKIQPVGDKAVVVDLRTGHCWELNQVGLEIWRYLEQGASITEVAEAVSSRYAVPEQQSATEIRSFAGALLTHGLIHPMSEPSLDLLLPRT